MIASVIPAIRTPRHIEVFDYVIPEGRTVKSGDIIQIPFRKGKLIGMISRIQKTSELPIKSLKPIGESFYGLSLNTKTQALLQALAHRSFSSPPTILHAWLGSLPKKNPDTDPIRNTNDQTIEMNDAIYASNSIDALIKQVIKDSKKHRILIISPWTSRAKEIANRLNTDALTSDLAMGKRFESWRRFMQGETPTLVTTRIGAWLATEADIVLIDEPENDDHKQDELSPRYDARWIAAYANQAGIGLKRFGTTPSVNTIASDPSILKNIPEIHPNLQTIDFHRADWSQIAGLQERTWIQIEEAKEQSKPIFIIHPIHGDQSKYQCADCGYTETCNACGAIPMLKNGELICKRCHQKKAVFNECPKCHGTTLQFAKPGRDRLKEELAKNGYQDIQVLSLGEWMQFHELPKDALIILTDISLLGGGVEDLRKKERLIIAWRRLCAFIENANAELITQGRPEILTEAKTWLSMDGCANALQKELEDRIAFHLPPATRLVKLIFKGSENHANRQLERLRHDLRSQDGIRIQGPFPVLYRPSHRIPRWIGHIYIEKNRSNEAIINALIPIYQTDTIIDLDPIAFFE